MRRERIRVMEWVECCLAGAWAILSWGCKTLRPIETLAIFSKPSHSSAELRLSFPLPQLMNVILSIDRLQSVGEAL